MGGLGTGQRQTIRVGLVGLGRFGRRHAAVLADLPDVAITAICDPDPDALAEVARRYQIDGCYHDLTAMLDAQELDACFLVSPEPLHGSQARLVVERGIAVFVEKPLAITATKGAEVLPAAERSGVPFQVGFLLRFDTRHAVLQSEVARGAFGLLVSLRAKRNVSRAWFADYGDRAHPVYETSIHDIDLLLWFSQSACREVFAVERNQSGLTYPDGCWALLQFESGAVGIVETSWFVPAGAPANVLTPTWHGTIDGELEIVGTERSGQIRSLDSGLAIWQADRTAAPETGLWPETGGTIGGALREQDRHFIQRVRTDAPSTVASAAEALAGLQIAAAIVESAATGQPVPVG